MWGNDRNQIAKMLTVVNLGVGTSSSYFLFVYLIFSNLLKWKQKKTCLCTSTVTKVRQTGKRTGRQVPNSNSRQGQPGKSGE